MSIIHLDGPPAQPDEPATITQLRDQLDTLDRVAPHLRDLGDLAALDTRRAALRLKLQAVTA